MIRETGAIRRENIRRPHIRRLGIRRPHTHRQPGRRSNSTHNRPHAPGVHRQTPGIAHSKVTAEAARHACSRLVQRLETVDTPETVETLETEVTVETEATTRMAASPMTVTPPTLAAATVSALAEATMIAGASSMAATHSDSSIRGRSAGATRMTCMSCTMMAATSCTTAFIPASASPSTYYDAALIHRVEGRGRTMHMSKVNIEVPVWTTRRDATSPCPGHSNIMGWDW